MLQRMLFPSLLRTCWQVHQYYHPTLRSSQRIFIMFISFILGVVSLKSFNSSTSPQISLILLAEMIGNVYNYIPFSWSHSLRDSISASPISFVVSFLMRYFYILLAFSSSAFFQHYFLTSQIAPRQFLYVGLQLVSFLPASIPLRMIQLVTSFKFFSIYFLFLGYFMVLTLPICILITIEPRRTPFNNGFSKMLSEFLLLFNENSQPSSFFIQFYTCRITQEEYYPIIGALVFIFSASFSLIILGPSLGLFSLLSLLLASSCVLLMLFLRLLQFVFRLWLIFKFMRSSTTAQKTSSLILPTQTSSSIVRTFCLGILSHYKRQSQTFLKTVIEPCSQWDCLTIFV